MLAHRVAGGGRACHGQGDRGLGARALEVGRRARRTRPSASWRTTGGRSASARRRRARDAVAIRGRRDGRSRVARTRRASRASRSAVRAAREPRAGVRRTCACHPPGSQPPANGGRMSTRAATGCSGSRRTVPSTRNDPERSTRCIGRAVACDEVVAQRAEGGAVAEARAAPLRRPAASAAAAKYRTVTSVMAVDATPGRVSGSRRGFGPRRRHRTGRTAPRRDHVAAYDGWHESGAARRTRPAARARAGRAVQPAAHAAGVR